MDNMGHDHEGVDCPICRGEMSTEFIERMKVAGEAEPSPPMTAEQFVAWLRDIDARSTDPQ